MAHISKSEFDKLIHSARSAYELDNKSKPDGLWDVYRTPYRKAFEKQNLSGLDRSPECTAYEAARDEANVSQEDNKGEIFAQALAKQLIAQGFILQDPALAAVSRVDEQINRYSSFGNLFKKSARDKIVALEALKNILLTKTKGTIEKAISQWEVAHLETIIQSRNIFKSENSRTGDTYLLIQQLKQDYGNEFLNRAGDIARENRQKMSQPFLNYIHSRTTWWQTIITFIFRNGALSEKKLSLARDAVEDINDFTGSYDALKDKLKVLRGNHAKVSADNGKNHYNLHESREEPVERQRKRIHMEADWEHAHVVTDTSLEKNVEPGQISSRSELADAFHESLRIRL